MSFEILEIKFNKLPEERAKAKTLEELKALAKKRGYSEGWALKVWQARQNKN